MTSLSEFYKGKRVLVTGHTGFKGSWLSIWLNEMGAVVGGISQDPSSDKDNYSLSDISGHLDLDARADIRNGHWLKEIITEWKPDIVFHLAAQPLVRLSYSFPVDTFETNVLGTINVMEAIRLTPSVRSAVMITTDKCYENKEQIWGYRENDPMGGHDPYSASKGAAELAISSWRRSFFNTETLPDGQHQQIASARAGNVIGGGDWAKDRIVPDCIRALEEGRPVEIRSPHAVRPWQHVLEPLSGYLLLAKLMWEHPNQYNQAWNFGPANESVATVWHVASEIVEAYGKGSLTDVSDPNSLHEASLLTLDITKARQLLAWQPVFTLQEAVRLTVDWYKRYASENVYNLCREHIHTYSQKAGIM
ncbi:MAG: CDP-glucose 4,6-dehydratase [Prevotellaceae bacterium]|nr:CDP-glucose 4,6-dehydratase [Prevotellaceae bacterium]